MYKFSLTNHLKAEWRHVSQIIPSNNRLEQQEEST